MTAVPGGGGVVSTPPTDSADGGSLTRDAAGDRALIRSEERVDIRTVRVPSGRVRLEKFVVTEARTVTVEVRREDVRLVELDAGESVPAESDADAADPQRWLTLHEERVVVAIEVMPVERVRLDVRTVVEQREITAELRSEQIAFDPDVRRPPAGGLA